VYAVDAANGDPVGDQVTVPVYPFAAVTVETGVPPVAGTVTPPIAGTETTLGFTASTVLVNVTVVAVEVSPALPPNSIRYAYDCEQGRSFHSPVEPQFVTAQSWPGFVSLFGSLPDQLE
jgi:hypothetical protein